MSRREKWFAGIGGSLLLVFIGLIVAGWILSRRFEPYIRQQAEQYLRDRFHADVRIATLHVTMPRLSPMRMLFTKGRGTMAQVRGERIELRMKARGDRPPLFTIDSFTCDVDLGPLW